MEIGYARVSTKDQTLDPQIEQLIKAGVDLRYLYSEIASGKINEREQLAKMLTVAREGDRITVWRLDRLGRDMAHLVNTVNDLRARGIEFRSLHEGIDTSTSVGRLFFHFMAAMAEFERELIEERSEIGRASAKAKGKLGGRKAKLSAEQREAARHMRAGGASIAEIARLFGVGRPTIDRALERRAEGGEVTSAA